MNITKDREYELKLKDLEKEGGEEEAKKTFSTQSMDDRRIEHLTSRMRSERYYH